MGGYKKLSSMAVEAAVVFHLTDEVNAGIQVSNPGSFGYGEKLPFIFTAGIGYDASENLFTGFQISKETDQPVSVNIAIQYRIIPQLLMLRGAFASGTAAGCVGVGFWWKEFRLDLVTNLHPQLGITPGILLYYLIKKKKEDEGL
jgi:hypothetical protein